MNCGYCGTTLPKTTHKGGRKREYCNDACKNRRHRQYMQEKHNADMLEDPIWEKKYTELYAFCVQSGTKFKEIAEKLKERLTESEKENEELKGRKDYYRKLYEELRDDYEVRMKAQGLSEEQIEEFRVYWDKQGSPATHVESLYKSDDKEKIRKLELEARDIRQYHLQDMHKLRQEIEWLKSTERQQAKRIAGLEAENSNMKDLLDKRAGTSIWQLKLK